MPEATFGILLLVVAGIMNANFTLPMKFTKKWAWENTWLVWTVFALLIFPPLMAYLTIPGLSDVYRQAGVGPVLVVALCGAGWGIAQVFFGLAVDSIGIALAFSMILGISAAVGSLVTLFTKHSEKIMSASGLMVSVGVLLVILGVAVNAVAGRKREAVLGTGPKNVSFGRGLLFCIISGLGSALVGLGVEWGDPIRKAARFATAPDMWTPNAIWLPLMVAGAIPNLIYCIYLIRKNRNANKFGESGTGSYWFLAALMAFFWFASTLMYGVSQGKMGNMGGAVAWPLFMSLIVIVASVVGVLTGEWKNTGTQPVRIQIAGVAVLIVAVIVLSMAT
jgi:L-rhamnose-H+ transport protein